MKNITIDPEFKSLIRPLDEKEYGYLEKSILDEGVREPLITWNGVLLDGHNRYEICQKHDIPYDTMEMRLDDRSDAKLWILHNQLARRNLTPVERIQVAMLAAETIALKAKENQRSGGMGRIVDKTIDVTREIAKMAGVSHGTVSQVKYIEKHADDEIRRRLRDNEISINAAYRISQMKLREQEEVADRIAGGQKASEAIKSVKKKIGSRAARELLATDEPTKRTACYVCGKHKPISVEHHVVPISELTDMVNSGAIEMSEMSTPVVWLCPNCHAYVHKAIDGDAVSIANAYDNDDERERFLNVVNARVEHIVSLGHTK